MLAVLAPSVCAPTRRIHDVTASVESIARAVGDTSARRLQAEHRLRGVEIRTTARRVAGVRFDVQVNQALPFLNFSSAQWEMLVAVSNLFKEALYENSVYDELMVVRPPKRVLGGVTVRF